MDRPELTVSPDCPVAFVDIETTGCSPGQHRIIDVAVIGARDGAVEFEWQSLVNPGVRIPAGITALTGIDNDMLAGAPAFEDIAAELRARLDGRVFVAHNVRFDYGFIRREFARLGGEWRAPNLCTVRLSRALYPGMPRHNLDAVMERHGKAQRLAVFLGSQSKQFGIGRQDSHEAALTHLRAPVSPWSCTRR